MEHGAAAPEIVHRECMTECVERAAGRRETRASCRAVSHPARHSYGLTLFACDWRRARQSGVRFRFLAVAEHCIPQLKTEGTTRCLRPLPSSVTSKFSKSISGTRKVRALQRCGIRCRAGTRSADGAAADICPWASSHKQPDLLLCERGQHKLRLFQLGNFRMLASGTALHIRAGVSPMHIGVDCANCGVTAGGLQSLFTHSEHGVFQVIL